MIKVTLDRLAQFGKAIKNLDKTRVLIGIPEDKSKRNDGSISNAQIGYIQENGSPVRNIPATPFLVTGVRAVAKQCAEQLKISVEMLMTNQSVVTTAQNKAGLIAQNSVKKTINDGDGFTPLSQATLDARKRKGFKGTKRLIRTGQLRNSITYVIRSK